MTSIAIIGASPEMGLAIGRTFGSHGFDVALISRGSTEIDDLVARLGKEDISAAAFPVDVLGGDALGRGIDKAARRFGGIDVLKYSAMKTATQRSALADPSEVYGAIAATNAVLPAMREANAGTLLYTTGAGSIGHVNELVGVRPAEAALRDWVLKLHEELAGSGIHAAHVAIDAKIGSSSFYGQPRVTPAQVAPIYWDLYTNRETAERIFRG